MRHDDASGLLRRQGPCVCKAQGELRLRRFHRAVLAFAALEYALWTSSCFWISDTLSNPYFWFDFLLSLVLLLLLPALGKAVDP